MTVLALGIKQFEPKWPLCVIFSKPKRAYGLFDVMRDGKLIELGPE